MIKEEIKNYLKANENGKNIPKPYASKAIVTGKFIAINVHIKKIRNISNKQPNFRPQGTRKQIKPKVSRRKE